MSLNYRDDLTVPLVVFLLFASQRVRDISLLCSATELLMSLGCRASLVFLEAGRLSSKIGMELLPSTFIVCITLGRLRLDALIHT